MGVRRKSGAGRARKYAYYIAIDARSVETLVEKSRFSKKYHVDTSIVGGRLGHRDLISQIVLRCFVHRNRFLLGTLS